MDISAILIMLLVQGTVSVITFYLFYRVLTSKRGSSDDEDVAEQEAAESQD